MKALILHQPYATLVALGVKQWETRNGPPNGSMRPAGVRGMPGLGIEPGERVAICAGAKAPKHDSTFGDYDVFVQAREPVLYDRPAVRRCGWEGARHFIPLPLGRVVCTAVVAEVLPIVDDYDDVSSAYDGPAAIEAVPDGALIRYPDWVGGLDADDDPHGDPGNRCLDISDQLPYGDWRPGRWAWRLTDVQPADGPVEVVRGNRQGVFEAAVTW